MARRPDSDDTTPAETPATGTPPTIQAQAPAPGTVTLTAQQLATMLEAAAQRGASIATAASGGAGGRPFAGEQNVSLASDDQPFAAEIAAFRGIGRPLPATRRIKCLSEVTGATFTAVVRQSTKHPNGRIVGLEDYEHPAGMTAHQRDGGLVPDGLQMMRADGKPDVMYKQWKWETFWQADLRAFNGAKFVQRFAANPDEPLPPWETGTSGEVRRADSRAA